MKKETMKSKEVLEKVSKIVGDDENMLVILRKENECRAVIRGDVDDIAQAMFSCMHIKDNPIGKRIYNIIRLNVVNIINNPSPFTDDLIKTFLHKMQENGKIQTV